MKMLSNEVFPNDTHIKALENMLESLDHIKTHFVPREEYNSKHGNILEENGSDYYGKFYNLYLPKDLMVGEQLFIINLLNQKLNLEQYSKSDRLVTKIKIMALIVSRMGSYGEDYLEKMASEYNLDKAFIERIKNHKLKITSDAKTFIQSIRNETNSKKLGDNEEDLKIGADKLAMGISKEFDLTFFRNGINSLRLGMETISQSEQKNITKKKGKITLHTKTDDLDIQSQLLREKIGIEWLKSELYKARETKNLELIDEIELKATNRVLKMLYEYPYQMSMKQYGDKPSKILEHKEVFCVGFSLLGHAFLSELGIEHKGLTIPEHSALEIDIGSKKYYFDGTLSDRVIPFEYGKGHGVYHEINTSGKTPSLHIFSGNTEETLLSQMYRNQGLDFMRKKEFDTATQMLDKAAKLNPKYVEIYNSKFTIALFQRKIKTAFLLLFTTDLLNGKNDLIHLLGWKKEKVVIRKLIENQDFDKLRLYLLDIENGPSK